MKRAIHLDFIQKTPFSMAQLTRLGLAMLLLAAVLSLVVWQQMVKKQNQTTALTQQVAGLNAQKEKLSLQTQAFTTQQLKAEQAAANPVVVSAAQIQTMQETLRALGLPWQRLFAALARVSNNDIALLGLEPNLKKGQLVLKGEARNMPALLRYIEQLEAQAAFSPVYLQQHSVDETSNFKPIRFSLLAKLTQSPVDNHNDAVAAGAGF